MQDTHGSRLPSHVVGEKLNSGSEEPSAGSANKREIDGAAIISHIRSGLDVYLEALKEVLIRKGGMISPDEIKAMERYTRFNRMGPLLVAEMAVAHANGQEERLAKSVAAWVGGIAAGVGVGAGALLMGATAPGWIMAASGVLASGAVASWASDRNLVEGLRAELEAAGDFMTEAGEYTDAILLDGLLKLTAGVTHSPQAIAELLSELASVLSPELLQRRLAMQAFDRMRLLVGEAEHRVSPIALDLDGNGINTLGIASGVVFDHAGLGRSWRTGWLGPDDGLLAIDLNGNGRIDDGGELFGNFTLLPDGERAENGFAALAVHDENGDGYIDQSDSVWTLLQVWRDANQDGVSQSDELHDLASIGIARIALDFRESEYVDQHGNEHRQIGWFEWADGRRAEATDIWFVVAPGLQTESGSDVPMSDELAQLPDLPGFGIVPNLRWAMALDVNGRLQALVEEFVREPDPRIRAGLIEPLLFEWAGVAEVSAGSRGPFVDARRMEAVERFLDHEFMQQGRWGREPGSMAGQDVEHAFVELWRATLVGLMLQSHFRELSSRLVARVDVDGGLQYDFSGVEDWLGGPEVFRDLNGILRMLDIESWLQESLAPLGWNPRTFLIDRIAENLEADPGFRKHLRQQMNLVSDADLARFGERPGWTPYADLFMVGEANSNQETTASSGDDLVLARPLGTVVTREGKNILFSADGARLIGQSGGDTYYFYRGAGMAEIQHQRQPEVIGRIRFGPGIAPWEVVTVREGSHLRIRVGDEGFLIRNWFSAPEFQIESLEFADQGPVSITDLKEQTVSQWLASSHAEYGLLDWALEPDAVLSFADSQPASGFLLGLAEHNVLIGSNDRRVRIYGGDGHDVLVAGRNDLVYAQARRTVLVSADRAMLYGGAGEDVYFFARGNGLAEVWHEARTAEFSSALGFASGIHPLDITLRRDGLDLQVLVGAEGLVLKQWFAHSIRRPQQFLFADGTEFLIANDLSGGQAGEAWQIDFLTAWQHRDHPDGSGSDDHSESLPGWANDSRQAGVPALSAQQLVDAVTRFDVLGFGTMRPLDAKWESFHQAALANAIIADPGQLGTPG